MIIFLFKIFTWNTEVIENDHNNEDLITMVEQILISRYELLHELEGKLKITAAKHNLTNNLRFLFRLNSNSEWKQFHTSNSDIRMDVFLSEIGDDDELEIILEGMDEKSSYKRFFYILLNILFIIIFYIK